VTGADGSADAGSKSPTTVVRCWGCRGSIPSPGPATAGYGGNTSCLEIRHGEERVVFDAGSGLRLLGRKLSSEGWSSDIHIFLTHFHWDHIQGFPFFSPLFDPSVGIQIHAPEQSVRIGNLFAGQMGPVYFPVPFGAVAADVHFRGLQEGGWEGAGMRVSHFRVRHPSHTVGYRVEVGGRTIGYVPDNEMRGEMYGTEPGWRDRFVEFLSGADVLFHDSMYTDEEYGSRGGWGHSTYGDSLDLARDAGVKDLYFFHHDPERSDDELNWILTELRDEAGRRALDMDVNAAFEGKQIVFGD
jgi:phosphoribosyl 1,2-cyclic phosphodiesterase